MTPNLSEPWGCSDFSTDRSGMECWTGPRSQSLSGDVPLAGFGDLIQLLLQNFNQHCEQIHPIHHASPNMFIITSDVRASSPHCPLLSVHATRAIKWVTTPAWQNFVPDRSLHFRTTILTTPLRPQLQDNNMPTHKFGYTSNIVDRYNSTDSIKNAHLSSRQVYEMSGVNRGILGCTGVYWIGEYWIRVGW